MTDPIIARLDRVKALTDAATDGPWEAREGDYGHEVIADDPEPGDLVIAHEVTQGHDDGQFDAEFIAAMRTDAVWMEAVIRAVMEAADEMDRNAQRLFMTSLPGSPGYDMGLVSQAGAERIRKAVQDAMGGAG
ncbi:hypothetical protein [Nesterenkonia suensis]